MERASQKILTKTHNVMYANVLKDPNFKRNKIKVLAIWEEQMPLRAHLISLLLIKAHLISLQLIKAHLINLLQIKVHLISLQLIKAHLINLLLIKAHLISQHQILAL